MLVGLWLTPFLIHVLGRNDYGLWLVGMQVLTYLLLADFGIIGVASRDVARLHGQEISGAGSGPLRVWFGQNLKVVLSQTALICLGALGVFLFAPGIKGNLRGPIGIALVVFALSYPFRLFPAILTGLQDLKFVGQLRLVVWALGTGLTVLLLLTGARFYALVCGCAMQQFGHDLVALMRLRRIRPDLFRAEFWRTAGPPHWRWFTRGFWISVSQAAYSLVAGTDLVIIASAINPTAVVNYSCTGKLVTVLANQPMILASTALPGVAQMKTSEPRERILQSTTSLAQAMVLLVGALGCSVLAGNRLFINLWLGPQFFGGILLTVLFVINLMIRQIDTTLNLLLFAFGYERASAIRCLIDGMVSVPLAYCLSTRLGVTGVILGFIGGGILVSIPTDVYLVMREFDLSLWELGRQYVPYLWRVAVIGGLAVAIGGFFDKANIVNLIAAVGSVLLIYLLIMLPCALKTPLGVYIRSMFAGIQSAARIQFSRSSAHS